MTFLLPRFIPARLTGTESFSTAPESRGLRINHDRARAALLERGVLHHRPALSVSAQYLRTHGLTELVVRRGGQTIERRTWAD